MFDPLPADLASALENAAPHLGAFANLHYRVEADSTNDLALSIALAGAPEGTAVLADTQHAGRGRRGREWVSPRGAGLYVSVVMRPMEETTALPMLTLGAGIAVARAIATSSRLPVELKWPNDIVIGRPWRKLGGVLCESVGAGTRVEAVVVGIGLNVLHAALPAHLTSAATSIEAELGRPVERGHLLVDLLGELRRVFEHIHAGQRDELRRAWREFGHRGLAGAFVTWQDGGRDLRGRARDIDADGALLVETATGVVRVIAGEISWEPLAYDK